VSLQLPIDLNIEVAQPSDYGWSNKQSSIMRVYGDIVRIDANVSAVGDQVEVIQTMTIKTRYTQSIMNAKTAVVSGKSYRVIGCYDPDGREKWLEVILQEVRK